MMKRFSFACFFVIATAACGDGGTPPPANNNNGQPNNGSTNAGTNGSTNSSTNGTANSSTNNQSTNDSSNASTNNASTNAATNNGSTNNVTCMELDPPLGPCDPICQTGCDLGDHCIIDGDPPASECGPSGIGSQGQACQADTECAVGLHCRSVGGVNQRCTTYCAPDREPTGCPANHSCVRLVADHRLGVCIAIENECDAVPDDTCADPDECYDTVTGRKCVPAGDVALDDACTRSSDCQPGLRCVGVGDTGNVCRPLCDPDGADDQCAAGETCNGLQDSSGDPLTWGACF